MPASTDDATEPPLIRFRRAASALAMGDGAAAGDGNRRHAADAAAALVALAAAGDGDTLETVLRPDPVEGGVAWTVCCYQIGDLSPSALRDFGDAAAAVRTLGGCGDATHVAAELLASTSTGLTWTALTRLGDETAFQLLDATTGRDPSAGSGREWGSPSRRPETPRLTELESARRRWDQLLAAWAVDPYVGLKPAPARITGPGPDEVRLRLDAVEAQIMALAEQVRELRAASFNSRPMS
jgi:hypothetical protein